MNTEDKTAQILSVFERHFSFGRRPKGEKKKVKLPGTMQLDELVKELLPGAHNKSLTNAATQKRLQRLRSQVFDAAFTGSLIENFPSVYERAWYNCARTLILSQVLIIKNERAAARPLMLEAFSNARKHHFTQFSLMLAGMLRLDAALQGSKTRFRYFCRMEKELSEVLAAEIKAGEYANRFLLEQKKRFSFAPSSIAFFQKAVEEIAVLSKKYRTHTLRLHHFRIQQRLYIMQREPYKMIALCTEFLHYQKKHAQFVQPQQRAETMLYIMDACIETRQPHKGLKLADECGAIYKNYPSNWFRYLDIHFVLHLHAGDYENAMDIYNKLSAYIPAKKRSLSPDIAGIAKNRNPNARQESAHNLSIVCPQEDIIEKWALYKIYLSLALNRKEDLKILPQSLLNKMPGYEMDKKGLAFPIYIAELIVLLQGEHHDRLVDFHERFAQYLKRHLNNKKQQRSLCFSKLVLILFKNNFDYRLSLKEGRHLHEKLKSHVQQPLLDYEMIEIIPYEHLWNILLRQLEEMQLQKPA